MRILARLLVAIALFAAGLMPAFAQFNSNQYAGTAGGTSSALVLTVPNWTANRPGIPLYFIPASDNPGASTLIVNSVGSAVAIKKPSNGGYAALTGGEIRSGQETFVYWDSGTSQWILPVPQGQTVQSSNLSNSALGFSFATNLQINASVSTNALTIALKAAGTNADATASTPILVPFRSSTIGDGSPKIVSLGSALSLTIASGSTMGCTNGQACRLWIVAICSSGLSCTGSAGSDTLGLCAFNASTGSSVASINEAALQTSAGGTSGGNNAQTYYCNISAVTARAVRILGYLDVTEATAGVWATAPTTVQIFGPGIKRPGDVVQTIYASGGSGTSSSSTLVTSNLTITPSMDSAANLVRATSAGTLRLNDGGSGGGQIRIFRDSTSIGIVINPNWGTSSPISNPNYPFAVDVLDKPSSATPAYAVFFSGGSGLTATFLGATFILQEIMG